MAPRCRHRVLAVLRLWCSPLVTILEDGAVVDCDPSAVVGIPKPYQLPGYFTVSCTQCGKAWSSNSPTRKPKAVLKALADADKWQNVITVVEEAQEREFDRQEQEDDDFEDYQGSSLED